MDFFRVIISILFITCTYYASCQNVKGKYLTNFFDQLTLQSDHTFLYEWHFDLAGSWSIGTWIQYGERIVFTMIPVCDTVTADGIAMMQDSLVYSLDKNAQRISYREF